VKRVSKKERCTMTTQMATLSDKLRHSVSGLEGDCYSNDGRLLFFKQRTEVGLF
jgi:hypothetical protein